MMRSSSSLTPTGQALSRAQQWKSEEMINEGYQPERVMISKNNEGRWSTLAGNPRKAPVQYQGRDDTNIKPIPKSGFLYHENTKADLTSYLASKSLEYSIESPANQQGCI